MIITILIATILGCVMGVITGLIPGLHTNTIALILMSLLLSDSVPVGSSVVLGFLVCMLLVHSFIDYIPSIFFAAPSSDTVLSALPGHKLLLKGEGYDALRSTVIGGFLSFIVALPFLPIFAWIITHLLDYISMFVAPVLLLVTTWLIISEGDLKRVFWSSYVFIISGVIGIVSLNSSFIKDPLFPLFSGLFGISILLMSLKDQMIVPEQKIRSVCSVFSLGNIFLSIISIFASCLMVLFPSLGPTQSATIAQSILRKSSKKKFLSVMGGINTLDALFTIVMLYMIGSARSGVLVTIQQSFEIGFGEFLIMFFSAFIGVGMGVTITLFIGKRIGKIISHVNYSLVSILILVFVSVMVWKVSGRIGLFVMSIATVIGIISQISGIKKVHGMGVLTIPTILNYS